MNNPCGICVTHAIRQGVDYGTLPDDIVGQKYEGGEIHEAITLLGGTAVCWYHAADVAACMGY